MQYPPLLPPVGVWAVSQSQCGRSTSQSGYRSFNLSVRLPIVDLVSRYLTNYLIGREPISQRIAPLISLSCGKDMLCGISVRFQTLSPSERQVAHALLTRPPLSLMSSARRFPSLNSVRLACVRHAASVRPEPGSNSLNYSIKTLSCSNLIQSFCSLIRY